MSRWKSARFATADALNAEIWACSALIHRDPALRQEGPVAVQQAALDPLVLGDRVRGTVLPWVPDLLGAEWTHPAAVHVVGHAYAGFIRGISPRRNTLPYDEYRRAAEGRWQTFARAYRQFVVEGDAEYYEPLPKLLDVFDAAASRFSVFDLCRASLVTPPGARRQGAACLHQLVERPESREWNRRRLEGSAGRLILALGSAAEHGLLRLFSGAGYAAHDLLSGRLFAPRPTRRPEGWVNRYALPGLTLRRRLEEPTGWVVTRGEDIRWFVIPVLQPQAAIRRRLDPGYQRTVACLETLRQRLRGTRAAVAR